MRCRYNKASQQLYDYTLQFNALCSSHFLSEITLSLNIMEFEIYQCQENHLFVAAEAKVDSVFFPSHYAYTGAG